MMSNETESAAAGIERPGGSGLSLNEIAPLAANAWLRYDVIRRMLPPGITSVLEVGCGQGAVGARLSEQYRYVGVEPDPNSYQIAAQRFAHLPHGEIRQTDVESMDPAELFDLVCAFEVLEHIEDDAGALKVWAGKIKPGGWFLLSVPAHQNRYAAWDELAGHFRRYDPAKLTALVEGAGLRDVEIREYGAPLGYALEYGRNAIGRRRLKALAGVSFEERTGGSGRLFQPSSSAFAALTRYGTAPFRQMQRVLPHGPALVLRAKLPAAGA
jgi:SAM-dependent methyltransferase